MTIIFLVDAFPCLSETFILNQITGLMDLGHEVFIFSASRSQEINSHDDVRSYGLLQNTYYHNEKPKNKLKRLLWAIFMILAYGHRNPKAIINSLNFFKYGKEALSLTYLYKVMLFLGLSKADILFCHYGPNGNFGALMKELGIAGKLVCMFHGYDIRRGLQQKDLYKPLFLRADALLSISPYNRGHLLEFGAPAGKVHDHPVGIDVKRYHYPQRKAFNPKDTIKILTVGRLIPEKGISFGLQAIHRLIEQKGMTNIEYDIIGDGPMREELEEQVRKLQLHGKVYFLGYQIQAGVIQMLKEAHIFFLPSIAEALPVVLMEAQASGLAVVATNVGSVDKVVSDTHSGYIVEPKDVNAMCEKLEALIKDPALALAMGQKGSQLICQQYDINQLNQRLVNHFQELLKRP